jgi:hypothetical protein
VPKLKKTPTPVVGDVGTDIATKSWPGREFKVASMKLSCPAPVPIPLKDRESKLDV